MNLLQNSQYSWYNWVLLELIHRRTQYFTIIDQEKQNQTNLNYFGTPWLSDLLCKHWFTSSVWNFCSWGADISLSKISLAARSDGCFTSYSFSKFQTYLSFTSQTLILHQFFNPSDNCNQFAFPRVVQNIGLPLYVALLSQTHKSQNAASALF